MPRLVLGVLYPLLIGTIPLFQLCIYNALEHRAGKPHEVVSPQRVLELPISPLPFLSRHHLHVADLPGLYPQIPDHGQQVEPDLGGFVAGYASLQHLHDLGREVIARAWSVADGRWLQSI